MLCNTSEEMILKRPNTLGKILRKLFEDLRTSQSQVVSFLSFLSFHFGR